MRIIFGEIGQVEFDPPSLLQVPHCKVKPEDVSLGVGVDSKEQVVFILTDLHNTVQVAPLEPRLEDDFLL